MRGLSFLSIFQLCLLTLLERTIWKDTPSIKHTDLNAEACGIELALDFLLEDCFICQDERNCTT
jgi:hypothetical protein